MNDPEEAIERVLTGVRDATAPTGMETRILGALASRAETKDLRRGWMGARKDWRVTTNGMAVAGVCGAVFVVALLVASRHRPDQVAGQVAANGVRMVAASRSTGGPEEFVPQRLKPQGSPTGYGTAKAVPLSKTAAGAAAQTLRDVSTADEHTDYDSLAMSEMLAPSRPAPPLLLTHQEKLLAQVVHKGDPEQVADLEPDVREKKVEIAKAEFHNFFEPPPMKDNE